MAGEKNINMVDKDTLSIKSARESITNQAADLALELYNINMRRKDIKKQLKKIGTASHTLTQIHNEIPSSPPGKNNGAGKNH